MRKIQVQLQIQRVNDETLYSDDIRDTIKIYADANNIWEALAAAYSQVYQYTDDPGIAVNSNLERTTNHYRTIIE